MEIIISLAMTINCLKCGDTIAINAGINKLWCPNCNGETNISNQIWGLLINEIEQTAKKMPYGEEKRTSVEDSKAGTVRVNFRKTSIDCYSCNSTIILDNQNESNITCDNCKTKINQRKVPENILPNSNACFLDEDQYQVNESIQKTRIQQPQELDCVNCGGHLKAEGDKRLLTCPYCNSEILIPDTIWHRLHPSSNIRKWYLALGKELSAKQPKFKYRKVYGVCIDSENVLYCIGETDNNDYAVWAMTPKGELKWMNLIAKDKRWNEFFENIAILPDNSIVIWNKYVHCGLRYRCKDGAYIGEFGGPEPVKATKPHLDFYYCSSFAPDLDSSMIAFINYRIIRFSKDGLGIHTWPKKFLSSQKLKPIYKNISKAKDREIIYNVRSGKFVLGHQLKNRPTSYSIYGTQPTVHIGSDGAMYILIPMQVDIRKNVIGKALLTKIDRNGKIIYKAELPAKNANRIETRTDTNGFAFVLMNDLDEDTNSNGRIIRVSPDGKEVKTITKAHSGVIYAGNQCFAVSNDGNIHVFGDGRIIRIFNSEGEQIWRNDEAQKADKERIEKRN